MELPTTSSAKKPSRAGLSMLLGGTHTVATVEHELPQTPSDDVAPGGAQLLALRLDDVHRNAAQPRTVFDAAAIHSLATSIEANGVIQPIAVRTRAGGGYEIVAGERRWLAARQAGLTRIPAVLHDVDERETLVLALVENLVRENLSPLETARAYATLQDEFQMTVTDLARSVGRSRPAVSNTLRLLELPNDVITLLEAGSLTEGHGRALLGCSDRVRMLRLARLSVERSLTVRALEGAVRDEEDRAERGISSARSRSKWNLDPAPELVARVERLAEELLGVRAKVRMGDKGAKLELLCARPAQLIQLVEQLERALAPAAV
ncbi:MAG: ParB/RepB/Spo0J family partition protein [Gaiellales bacterium]